jgi:hypothetical protein
VVHLKDFSLLSPTIQNSDLLKAIETAIPATAIERASARRRTLRERNKQGQRRKKSFFTSTFGSLSASSNEPLVERFDAGCTQKLN